MLGPSTWIIYSILCALFLSLTDFAVKKYADDLGSTEIALVSYMISLKRLSLLFSIVLGTLFLNEKGFKEKMAGGILMILGIIIITVSG